VIALGATLADSAQVCAAKPVGGLPAAAGQARGALSEKMSGAEHEFGTDDRDDATSIVTGSFWIFGYGSLMWNPGFPFEERRHAVLQGFHRRFCIRSTIYRGTPEQPGLVLGIDAGGECHGMAFLVDASRREEVLAYLYARELPSEVYTPTWVSILINGEPAEALTFVVKRDHRQFTCLPEDEMVAIIASSAGASGSNFEYLENTVHALHALGVPDRELDILHRRVRTLRGDDKNDPAANSAAG
jgi:glutathione-specific gamma-glutamylcyclotransferase